MNAVQLIEKDVRSLTKNRGLFVYKYQTNLGKYKARSSICLDTREIKPRTSNGCDVFVVSFDQMLGKGKTEKSAEYRAWKMVFDDLVKNY